MKYTNQYGLPEAIVRAVTHHIHEKAGDISVTQLIGPPRIHQLRERHPDEITEDVSDRMWALLGSSVHAILEAADVAHALQEETLTTFIHGVKVYGTPDYYVAERKLTDFKITSVWSVIDGVKPEWEAQLNSYAYLYQLYGFTVHELWICAILRDWSQGRVKQGGDYPKTPFVQLPVPLWSQPAQLKYLENRVVVHQVASETPDDFLPICTEDERWQRPTTWAVMKMGNKRAKKVCDTPEETNQVIAGLIAADMRAGRSGAYGIEKRPGESVRCERYCNVSHLCNWWQAKKPSED